MLLLLFRVEWNNNKFFIMQKGDDPYQILGVPEDAETAIIRKAYHKLAVKHHPDKHPEGTARDEAHHVFAKISGAYELLSDPIRRRDYDEQQEEGDDDYHPGFDGYAEYDYDGPMYPSPSTDIVKHKGGGFKGMFKKKKKPMKFHDPYEVFKKAFKEEFGYAYPGAKWDNVKQTGQTTIAKAKNAPLAIENGGVGDGTANKDKKHKGILSIFKKKEDALVPYEGDDNKGGKPPPGNNRPTSMETKTHKIEHPDGTVETITETIITRPDGSTESSRTTDMPEKKTRDWTKPKDKPKGGDGKGLLQITNGGGAKQKLLTGGKGGGKQKLITSGKKKESKPLQITNGEKGKAPTKSKAK